MHKNIGVTLKPNFTNSLVYIVLYFFKYEFSSITLRILNLHNKSPEIFASDNFDIKCRPHPFMPMLKLYKTTYPQIIRL